MNVVHQSMGIRLAGIVLEAEVLIPETAQGVVMFAHGSGSGRHSPRNRAVAKELQEAGLGTVLVDLLTDEEERVDARTAELRFDIPLLAARLITLTDWLTEYEPTSRLQIGLFGASTGAAAALIAAATRPAAVQAVVSRGGRPDLAGEALSTVHQPTLLIVGERDPVVIQLNRQAMACLPDEVRLEVVPGATHLFAEPGALERVAALARDWFERYLTRRPG